MLVGMGHTIVGVLMGVGMLMVVSANMIGMQMHSRFSFDFFFIIAVFSLPVKTFIFLPLSPCGACGSRKKRV